MSTPQETNLTFRIFGERLHELWLTARPSMRGASTAPVCGVTYELLLLRGDTIVSTPHERGRCVVGATLGAAFGLSDAAGEAVCRFLLNPTHDFLVMSLPTDAGLMIIAPVPHMSGGEAVAFLPRGDSASFARVIAYSFGENVWMDDHVQRLAQTPMRKQDEETYVYLRRLLRSWRQLTQGQDIRIEDRRELSRQLLLTSELMLDMLGDQRETTREELFPVPYPFFGSYCPSRAAWMLLCLCCGMYRCLPSGLSRLRYIPDNEHLLPMIEIPAGNRTVIPTEWEECRRLALEVGMQFEIKRSKNALRVAFCPMVPDGDPRVFYSLCVPPSVLWQLRAALHGYGLDNDERICYNEEKE